MSDTIKKHLIIVNEIEKYSHEYNKSINESCKILSKNYNYKSTTLQVMCSKYGKESGLNTLYFEIRKLIIKNCNESNIPMYQFIESYSKEYGVKFSALQYFMQKHPFKRRTKLQRNTTFKRVKNEKDKIVNKYVKKKKCCLCEKKFNDLYEWCDYMVCKECYNNLKMGEI
jgi:hypothetical protein